MASPTTADPHADAMVEWLNNLPSLPGVRPLDRIATAASRSGPRTRYRRQGAPGEATPPMPKQDIFSLVREAGVLRWRAGAAAPAGPRPRAGGRAALPPGQVVKQFAFERLPASKVYEALTALDRMLTPQAVLPGGMGGMGGEVNGLRRLRGGVLEPFVDPSRAGGRKVLLLIHGTFSNSESIVGEGLQSRPLGRELLQDAEKRYDLVLAYDHPTLSVSPMLNAFDLAALLRPAPAQIDIVCHSRGGLVARWFCEALAEAATRRRVVFVGAPLAGTSLAAAPSLKNALDLLTNIADALRSAGDLVGANALFTAAAGLLRVVGSVTGGVLNTALLDAAIALVPGLDAMSRIGNNQELSRLRQNTGSSDFHSGQIRYFAIQSNFEPQAIGWNFLRLFSRPMARLGDFAVDRIFAGPNDLVVDTASMAEVADGRPITLAHDFKTNDRVHHVNYFVQPETVRAIRSSLEIRCA
jgi:hypothetical protein